MKQTNEYLAHYGVLGQKWGVRRYQPYPKGDGPKGKFVRDLGSKAKSAARSSAKNAVEKAKTRYEQRKLEKSEASKRGMRVSAYKATVKQEEFLREKALKSHNPREVTKGMRYLSDAELDQKLQRLQKEAKIRSIAEQMPASKRDQMVKRVADLAVKEVIVPTIQKNVQPVIGSTVEKTLASNIAKASGKNSKQASANAERVQKAFDGDPGVKYTDELKRYSRYNTDKYGGRNFTEDYYTTISKQKTEKRKAQN